MGFREELKQIAKLLAKGPSVPTPRPHSTELDSSKSILGKKEQVRTNLAPKKETMGAFSKRVWLTRAEADRWLKENLMKGELSTKFFKYYPKRLNETDDQRAKRIEEELFGKPNDPLNSLGPFIERRGDWDRIIKKRKELKRSIENERNLEEKERKKLKLNIFDSFIGKK